MPSFIMMVTEWSKLKAPPPPKARRALLLLLRGLPAPWVTWLVATARCTPHTVPDETPCLMETEN